MYKDKKPRKGDRVQILHKSGKNSKLGAMLVVKKNLFKLRKEKVIGVALGRGVVDKGKRCWVRESKVIVEKNIFSNGKLGLRNRMGLDRGKDGEKGGVLRGSTYPFKFDRVVWNLEEEIAKVFQIGLALSTNFGGKKKAIMEMIARRNEENDNGFRALLLGLVSVSAFQFFVRFACLVPFVAVFAFLFACGWCFLSGVMPGWWNLVALVVVFFVLVVMSLSLLSCSVDMDPHIDLNQELSDCCNNNGCGEEHADCENNDGGGEEHIDSGNNDGGSLIEEQKILEPCNGMEFESDANAYSYYLQYAKQMGFDASKTQCIQVGVKTSKIFVALAKMYKGYENIGFMEKDMRNLFDKERRLALEPGDANAMLELFTSMQEVDPNFFYAMKLDEEHHLKNVFWVDSKGREDYKIFGDVVSFDTTYRTNKYLMHFAPFIGTWNRAMGGKNLVAILTDQDQAMKAAIAEVFPDAKYRFCLWHILRKEDFEQKWHNMVETFELHGENWIRDLFKDRKYWAPTYIRNTFFARMSTTSRSESINSFFDKYVNKTTSLKEFVKQYKVAAQDRAKAKKHADFNLHKKPTLRSPSLFEKQMSKIYTFDILKKFQVEVTGVIECHPVKENDEDMNLTYRSCGVFQIPKHYILKRWSKDAKDGHTTTHVLKEADPKKQRFKDLFEKASKLVEEGSIPDQSYKVANRALEEALKKFTTMNHSLTGVKELNCASHEFHNVDKENVNSNMLSNLLDPKEQANLGLATHVTEDSLQMQYASDQAFNNSHNSQGWMQNIVSSQLMEDDNFLRLSGAKK
ncbi:hypothetical protein EZV62_023681 [Acer yangbiense]|uniref:Protein FAR1-RELATED SEQUENCE n=1 Tax=Acer yangbiense TaxID=1000413 RepID=A0A5C7H2R6_9ROSI|nr:hypothetical protein EZV62_023681 [Acer yangbiense]